VEFSVQCILVSYVVHGPLTEHVGRFFSELSLRINVVNVERTKLAVSCKSSFSYQVAIAAFTACCNIRRCCLSVRLSVVCSSHSCTV